MPAMRMMDSPMRTHEQQQPTTQPIKQVDPILQMMMTDAAPPPPPSPSLPPPPSFSPPHEESGMNAVVQARNESTTETVSIRNTSQQNWNKLRNTVKATAAFSTKIKEKKVVKQRSQQNWSKLRHTVMDPQQRQERQRRQSRRLSHVMKARRYSEAKAQMEEKEENEKEAVLNEKETEEEVKEEESQQSEEIAITVEKDLTTEVVPPPRRATVIPDGWERHVTEDDEAFYMDPDGEVQWDKPPTGQGQEEV